MLEFASNKSVVFGGIFPGFNTGKAHSKLRILCAFVGRWKAVGIVEAANLMSLEIEIR